MASKKNISGRKTSGRQTRKTSADIGDGEDAYALWDEIANSVKRQPSSRISPVDLPAPQAKKPVSAKQALSGGKIRQGVHIRPTPSKNQAADKTGHVIGPANLALPVYAGIDRSSAKKLQQGRMALEARVDLHGLSQLQARQRLQQFIHHSIQNGLRTILVITGKGKAGRGVLRENVPQWLSEPPLGDLVIAFGPSRPQDGGAGALYVRLKRARGA